MEIPQSRVPIVTAFFLDGQPISKSEYTYGEEPLALLDQF